MKQSELFSYVYDFISQLIENQEIFDKVRRIILFGSVARGNFTPKSDIDLFIDIKSLDEEKEVDRLIRLELYKFETRAEKTWFLRKINLPIKPVIGNIEQEKWKDLRDLILNYGKIIYGDFEHFPDKTKHKILIVYNILNLSQKRKMSFLRRLYGYTITKGRKKYVQGGVIDEINGEKISANSILIDANNLTIIKKLLKEHGLKYTLRDAWIK